MDEKTKLNGQMLSIIFWGSAEIFLVFSIVFQASTSKRLLIKSTENIMGSKNVMLHILVLYGNISSLVIILTQKNELLAHCAKVQKYNRAKIFICGANTVVWMAMPSEVSPQKDTHAGF